MKKVIKKLVKNRIKKGIKEKGVDKYKNYETEYIPKIKHEIKTFIHNGAIDFMLLDTEIKEWAEKNKIYHGISRGSKESCSKECSSSSRDGRTY